MLWWQGWGCIRLARDSRYRNFARVVETFTDFAGVCRYSTVNRAGQAKNSSANRGVEGGPHPGQPQRGANSRSVEARQPTPTAESTFGTRPGTGSPRGPSSTRRQCSELPTSATALTRVTICSYTSSVGLPYPPSEKVDPYGSAFSPQPVQSTRTPCSSPESGLAPPVTGLILIATATTLAVVMFTVPDARNGLALIFVVLTGFLGAVLLFAALGETEALHMWVVGGLAAALVGAFLTDGVWILTEPDCHHRSDASPPGVTVEPDSGLGSYADNNVVAKYMRVTVSVQDVGSLDADSVAAFGVPLGRWLPVHIVHENTGSRQVVVRGSHYKLLACQDVYPPTRPSTLVINPKLGDEMLLMFDVPEGILDRPVYLEHIYR